MCKFDILCHQKQQCNITHIQIFCNKTGIGAKNNNNNNNDINKHIYGCKMDVYVQGTSGNWTHFKIHSSNSSWRILKWRNETWCRHLTVCTHPRCFFLLLIVCVHLRLIIFYSMHAFKIIFFPVCIIQDDFFFLQWIMFFRDLH